ncbi:MAG TPA: type 1 glutamine amidotransferase [Nocardioides sp.]|jgi:GMP synthase (glutamine-hydrolysing)|nr:type 1 glutamine amidotransferase [Nocardioides sp.]
MPSILIIQPDAEDPPERFEQWLIESEFEVRLLRPYDGDQIPAMLAEDALIVLGGDMNANQITDYPWLADIQALLRRVVAEHRPILGICLGGQLLASAMGGSVESGSAGMEAGVVTVRPRAGVGSDPLARGLPWPLAMITMHRDAITELPPGARWLGESAPYPHQFFRVGRLAWGVQFHPEVSPATYAGWATYVHDTGEALRRVVDGVTAVSENAEQIQSHSYALAKRFASVVRHAIK